MFGDYFNYLSPLATITFLVALVIITPLGLFLCRYSAKFVAISMIGLAEVTIYLAQSSIAIVHLLENTGRNPAGFLFQWVLPPVFFLIAAGGVISWGIEIWTRNRPGGLPAITRTRTAPGRGISSGRLDLRKRWGALRHWFTTREGVTICAIAVAVLSIHLVNINRPAVPGILDEKYYVPEATHFLHGQTMAHPEHPPLGKWLIAAGMFLFGDNPAGWRAFSILFSIAAIFIFYFICRRLIAAWPRARTFIPVMATFLMASENLNFVLGQAAMLDVFYVTFMLLGFLLYLRGNYLASGMVMGLSVLCKDTAIFGIAAIVIHWAITRRGELAREVKDSWHALQGKRMAPPQGRHILNMFQLLAAIPIVWGMLIVPLEYPAIHQYPLSTQWYNPISRALYMVWYHLVITFSGAPSGGFLTPGTPWQWLLSPSAINVNFAGPSPARYLGSIGWTAWALIVPVIIFLIYEAIRHRKQEHEPTFFLLSWLAGVYGLLLILQPLTDRVTFEYYFYPAVPAVCLGIAWGAWRLWGLARQRPGTNFAFWTGMAIYLLGTVFTFVVMSPLGTNLIRLPA